MPASTRIGCDAWLECNFMMIPTRVVICLSGGGDSVPLLYEAVAELGPENVAAAMFDYHAPHNSSELLFGRGHCLRLGVKFRTIELNAMGGLTEKDWKVPLRNAEFAIVASRMALEIGADSVLFGCNKDDAEYPFPDCSPKFFRMINAVVKASGYDVEIRAPYLKKHKWEIMAIAREHGVPLHELWSCYQPKNGAQCGVCPACLKLKSAIEHK